MNIEAISRQSPQVTITYDHLENDFTKTDKNQILYSKVVYRSKDFTWDAVLPTVRIPYKDPSVGFLLGGSAFASVGIYRRDRGVVVGKDSVVDIVTIRNSTLSLVYKSKCICLRIKHGTSYTHIPLGIFLKAYTGLPYSVLFEHFAIKSYQLIRSFPCAIGQKEFYTVNSLEEPTVEDCIDYVYSSLSKYNKRKISTDNTYSTQWKFNRIQSYFDGLQFKTVQNMESVMSLWSRIEGTYLDQDVSLSVFNEDGSVKKISIERGKFVTKDIQEIFQWHDIHSVRVKTTRSFLLQEDNPMLFRIVGYKLAAPIISLNFEEGRVLSKNDVQQINQTPLRLLEVFTPEGRKVVTRSGDTPDVGDFVTMCNILDTSTYHNNSESSQHELRNRIVITYDKQVEQTVELVYKEVEESIAGCDSLKAIMANLPKLPDISLEQHLRDVSSREVTQAEVTNIMTKASAERRASALLESSPKDMTQIQKGQYGRIDSLHSPESNKVGSVQELTFMSKINSDGQIEAPYEKVVNGVPTGEVVYLTAAQESGKYIAGWDNPMTDPIVMAHIDGDVVTVSRDHVSYRDVSPFCDMSLARATIPFPEFSQPRRSLMATKMSGQAIPLLYPERPRVSTGADMEVPYLYYIARDIVKTTLGEDAIKGHESQQLTIINTEWTKVSVIYTCIFAGKSLTYSTPCVYTDRETLYNYDINFKEGYKYNLDDIVFYSHNCDTEKHNYFVKEAQGALPLVQSIGRPSMALGTNLTVAYKTYRSSTIDDAVTISSRVVRTRKLSSIQIFKYSHILQPTASFATSASLKIGSHVYTGDPVISIFKKSSRSTSTRQLYAKQDGIVVFSETTEGHEGTTMTVWVATVHDAEVGDKVAGRYGNKSVIAKIVPEEDMPYNPETGEHIDIILSPLGIPSRMNNGQLLEVTLGAVMALNDTYAVVTPFYPNIKEIIAGEYEKAGLHMTRLYDPVYGRYTERPVMTGVMYILKLEQFSNLKWSAVGTPVAVDPVFGQPITSLNTSKGQSMEEMITWALTASGCKKCLDRFFSLYSSNHNARDNYFELLRSNTDGLQSSQWVEQTEPAMGLNTTNNDALVTQIAYRMLGQDIHVDSTTNTYKVLPLNMNDINVVARPLDLKNHTEPVMDLGWCKIKLQAKVVNPFWIESFPLSKILGIPSVKAIAKGTDFVNISTRAIVKEKDIPELSKAQYITGIEAIVALLETTSLDDAFGYLRQASEDLEQDGDNPVDSSDELETVPLSVQLVLDDNSTEGTNDPSTDEQFYNSDDDDIFNISAEYADLAGFLKRLKNAGMTLGDLVWSYIPVLPKMFRQTTMLGGRESEHSFTKQLVAIVYNCSTSKDIYNSLRAFIGYNAENTSDLISIRGYFFGKNSSKQHGIVRSKLLSKRIGFSGRSLIVPSQDPSMSPYFVGLPWRLVMIELGEILAIRMQKRAQELSWQLQSELGVSQSFLVNLSEKEWLTILHSLWQYNPSLFNKMFPTLDHSDSVFLYNFIREQVRHICEDNVSPDGLVNVHGEWLEPKDIPENVAIDAAVCFIGRQPTLHKKSIRSFFVKLVDGFALQIHPTVCSGFNADFDGDTMHNEQLLGELKHEALTHNSVLQDLVSEKDGGYTLGIAQDTALGLYAATAFKNNSYTFVGEQGKFYFFDDPTTLRENLEYGTLNYYDAVLFYSKSIGHFYLSSAGRVLLNVLVPGALTSIPFQDKWEVLSTVFGDKKVDNLCELLYDTPWVSTSTRPEGRPVATKIEDILLQCYHTYGDRASVNLTQQLFEIGVCASDLYGVSASLNDLSVDVDVSQFMEEPKSHVAKLNTLQQMGLITNEERKNSSVRAWERARKQATTAVVNGVSPDSDIGFLMYSGARGNPALVMQSVGFVGTVSKTTTQDIEYPILHGYGSGLTSLELSSACYPARIGVISTQMGTQETGYGARQTVYMSSGMQVKEDDCGIKAWTEDIHYSFSETVVTYDNGEQGAFSSLLGRSILPDSLKDSPIQNEASKCGFVITDELLRQIGGYGITQLQLYPSGAASVCYVIDPEQVKQLVETGYSYSLPFTESRKITQKTMDWVQEYGLSEIICFDRETSVTGKCFEKEAHLPVDYDSSKYTIYLNGSKVSDEVLYGRKVLGDSEKFYIYKRLLDAEGCLTTRTLRYLTKKRISTISFEGGDKVKIVYSISTLFRDLVIGCYAYGLPYLDESSTITKETLDVVEQYQLEAIAVRTSLTCLSTVGICSKCRGKSLSTAQFSKVGDNLGIAAAQSQCEPLSQSTLNVVHSGGKRDAGLGLVSGLDYYRKLIKGKVTSKSNEKQIEQFATVSGYVKCSYFDKHFVQIVDDDDNVILEFSLEDPSRLNVPNGAYIEAGDTLISGLPCLTRYSSTDVFISAMRTRYLLLKEYHAIFESLKVSPKNYEILAREQTSNCYLVAAGTSLPPVKDTSAECKQPTGCYVLKVSTQGEVVKKYSGIASYAFEYVTNAIASAILDNQGLSLNSDLGNIVTGTPVGSTVAKFIPTTSTQTRTGYRTSAVREAEESLEEHAQHSEKSTTLALTDFDAEDISSIDSFTDSLLAATLDAISTVDLKEISPTKPEETVETEETTGSTVVKQEDKQEDKSSTDKSSEIKGIVL